MQYPLSKLHLYIFVQYHAIPLLRWEYEVTPNAPLRALSLSTSTLPCIYKKNNTDPKRLLKFEAIFRPSRIKTVLNV